MDGRGIKSFSGRADSQSGNTDPKEDTGVRGELGKTRERTLKETKAVRSLRTAYSVK